MILMHTSLKTYAPPYMYGLIYKRSISTFYFLYYKHIFIAVRDFFTITDFHHFYSASKKVSNVKFVVSSNRFKCRLSFVYLCFFLTINIRKCDHRYKFPHFAKRAGKVLTLLCGVNPSTCFDFNVNLLKMNVYPT